jgi:hypothetical protein
MAATAVAVQPTPEALVKVALGQKGYIEKGGRDGKSGNITKFGKAFGMDAVAWCSIFVWWCFFAIHIDLKKVLTGNYASAELAMEAWQRHGWKIYKNPKLGDVVFFHFNGEHEGANHTGIVIGADSNGVHTVEGNTSLPGAKGSQVNGGVVAERYRPYGVIIGYGRYPWPRGTVVPKPPVLKASNGKAYPTLCRTCKNMKEADVKRLQTLLHIKADGVFGATTELHVKQAQFNRHLAQDGVAGPLTLSKLGF